MGTQAQIDANRRNAERSTGPTTDAGKKKSCMNALRTALTAQVPVMTEEDARAYQRFCAELFLELKPETLLECHAAQLVADGYWRLHRAHTIENNMLTLGHYEPSGNIHAAHHEIQNTLTHAREFREHAPSFNTLTLVEQRIDRALQRAIERLDKLQADRRAARAEALEKALHIREYNEAHGLSDVQPNPSPNVSAKAQPGTSPDAPPDEIGFVFSARELDLELDRRHRLQHGKLRFDDRLKAENRPLQAAA